MRYTTGMKAAVAVLSLNVSVLAQFPANYTPPSTYPHEYPGMPSEDYSPEWQKYYSVNSSLLPNITFSFTSYAGNIRTDTPGHPNNTLFFWAVEHQGEGHGGSLTAKAGERENTPWIIWLQGGPGASSMYGLMEENGPFRVNNDGSLYKNNYSWSMLADTIWVDNPVGVGYSTADSTGYVPDETRVGPDFVGFLSNLVKVFPSLKSRPLYLTGESYAGFYIPYISTTIIEDPAPPVNLVKLSIGDGLLADDASFNEATVVSTLNLYPELIDYDIDVYESFLAQHINCGYDINFRYPEPGSLPQMPVMPATNPYSYYGPGPNATVARVSSRGRGKRIARYLSNMGSLFRRHNELEKRSWREKSSLIKRDLVKRVNSTELNPWYGCYLWEQMYDYVYNYTAPWANSSFNDYDIPDAINPDYLSDTIAGIQPFLQNNVTIAAIHAPTSFLYCAECSYPFANPEYSDNVPAPVTLLNELAAALPIVFYYGNDDSLVPHLGGQIAIQNMTFGGLQGFSRVPSTPWYVDTGAFAGIVHQERGITYAVFKGAGHQVPAFVPEAAFVFLREFILGHNKTGFVFTRSNGTAVVVGGENASLSASGIAGGPIWTGSVTSAGTYSWPSETVAAWETFIATRTATAGP